MRIGNDIQPHFRRGRSLKLFEPSNGEEAAAARGNVFEQLKQFELLHCGRLERTIPDKPRSLQDDRDGSRSHRAGGRIGFLNDWNGLNFWNGWNWALELNLEPVRQAQGKLGTLKRQPLNDLNPLNGLNF